MIDRISRWIIAAVAALATCIAAAHPGPDHIHPCAAVGEERIEEVRTLPGGVVMTVSTVACRPVRHGATTGIHRSAIR